MRRREFIQMTAVAGGLAGSVSLAASLNRKDERLALLATAARSGASQSSQEFKSQQEGRRKELWGLLGDLPWNHRPGAPRVVSKEEHDTYTLERLVLDLNGLEPVPAILLIPKKR